jgi:predicted CxxxxCH...CXXCH cytochrome family protein
MGMNFPINRKGNKPSSVTEGSPECSNVIQCLKFYPFTMYRPFLGIPLLVLLLEKEKKSVRSFCSNFNCHSSGQRKNKNMLLEGGEWCGAQWRRNSSGRIGHRKGR